MIPLQGLSFGMQALDLGRTACGGLQQSIDEIYACEAAQSEVPLEARFWGMLDFCNTRGLRGPKPLRVHSRFLRAG
jgi:hypothetical protein